MDNIKLTGTVDEALKKDDVHYLIVSMPCPISRHFEDRERFRIPVTREIYEKYLQKITDSQQGDSKNYVAISGELEISVEEIPPF